MQLPVPVEPSRGHIGEVERSGARAPPAVESDAMHVLILGATRGVGRHVLAQALDGGHDVTAFARTAATIPGHPRLRAVQGDVSDGGALLNDAMRGQDVVVSALGKGMTLKSEGVIQRSVPPILEAMRATAVRRLIVTSAIGVGETIRDAPLFSRLMIRLLLKDIYADKIAGEQHILRSDLDWTLVQPAQLTDGPLTRTYRAGERLVLRGMPKISRADAAHFIIRQLDDAAYVRKIVLIAY